MRIDNTIDSQKSEDLHCWQITIYAASDNLSAANAIKDILLSHG
jgi:hypothetical protein